MMCDAGGAERFSQVRSVLVAMCVVLGLAMPGWAQFDTASVLGAVRDASGAVVPGATMTLTSTATGVSQTQLTSAEGDYEFLTVKPGTYLVTAEKPGFSVALTDNVHRILHSPSQFFNSRGPGSAGQEPYWHSR